MSSSDAWSDNSRHIHMYSIEVRSLSRMPIVNPLHAKIYWPFQDGDFFVEHFGYLGFMLVFVRSSCLFRVALWLPAGMGLASLLTCLRCVLVFV